MFTQYLNILAGPNVVFLYGGVDCISDIDDVAATLSAGLYEKVNPELKYMSGLLACINYGRDNLSDFFNLDPVHLLQWERLAGKYNEPWEPLGDGQTPPQSSTSSLPSVSNSEWSSERDDASREAASQQMKR